MPQPARLGSSHEGGAGRGARSDGRRTDETDATLDFYAAVGVRELMVLRPCDHAVELFRLVEKRLLPVTADADGGVRSDVLGVRILGTGDALQFSWAEGSAVLSGS